MISQSCFVAFGYQKIVVLVGPTLVQAIMEEAINTEFAPKFKNLKT
jgi:hypothetical protein